VCRLRPVPLGGNWRTRTFQFQLLPRCHGECGSPTSTGTQVRTRYLTWAVSSLPWFQVGDRFKWSGSRTIFSESRAATFSANVLLFLLAGLLLVACGAAQTSVSSTSSQVPASPPDSVSTTAPITEATSSHNSGYDVDQLSGRFHSCSVGLRPSLRNASRVAFARCAWPSWIHL